ncbi:LacI family DNA-binding transcriptional regulator [Bacillus sp. NPDC077411]|uniref:LacI family DNA-binding transcriptional regulator n=1 Tax=Bacillus bruguierae TaxID=3127667 RepID=A0ABU8FKB2_9BACI|nr:MULTISPECIES: LacI family DNA-binding transcriptional regulator [unclassified Bacillus (in: firmicutes)]SFI56912.1 DNA-binding transcriptional regulator, LacI/PurR family [Bacillus sp. 71mf]SFS45977.1 DNA-binding transcriptional regulator, LacI/PurR family [Bacillus sp. 103mf]
MTVTIKDVAKKANVAPSTVSRVIADNPSISEKTKRRVRKVMAELGYHPNLNARSLANQTTKTIGLVMPSSASKAFQNPFFPEVIRGISSFAHGEEYSLYMSTGETEEEIFNGVVKMVQGRQIGGIILLYSRMNDRILEYLHEQNFPFVLIGKPYERKEDITYIDNDNYAAAREVTEYLISLGHDRIAFIGGDSDLLVTKDRLAGMTDALKLADISLPSEYILNLGFLRESGQEAVEKLMTLGAQPTAIIATDDLIGLGVLSALSEKGISVPKDISIVSFNNVLLSEIANPPLTTIDVNIYQLGYEAARYLVDKVEHCEVSPKCIIIPHKLVKRQTCSENKKN